jgi:hypothetical protein
MAIAGIPILWPNFLQVKITNQAAPLQQKIFVTLRIKKQLHRLFEFIIYIFLRLDHHLLELHIFDWIDGKFNKLYSSNPENNEEMIIFSPAKHEVREEKFSSFVKSVISSQIEKYIYFFPMFAFVDGKLWDTSLKDEKTSLFIRINGAKVIQTPPYGIDKESTKSFDGLREDS